MYRTRHIEEKLKSLKKNFKVVLVVGARQVGKSTMYKNLFPEMRHITFDPVQDLYGARTDPDLFLQNFPSPLILDEVQYVPELLSALKRKVDDYDEMGQYFLTGSHNISILKNVSESLAGRVGIIHLGGMTIFEATQNKNKHWFSEYLFNNERFMQNQFSIIKNVDSIYRTLWKGSFPGLLEKEDDIVPTYLSSYIQTYVERDVRLIENIKDLSQFDRFMGLAAALTAQEINSSHLGREIGINYLTAARWLDIMNYSYLWHETMPYSGNTIKRISKKRKGYITDTGLACYLQRISSPEALARHPLLGSLFETFCVNLIRNISDSLALEPKFYHWRSNGGAEVDLVLEINGTLFPIEMKCKSNLTHNDTSGLRAFRETYQTTQIAKGVIMYCGSEIYMIDKNTIAIPWNAILA